MDNNYSVAYAYDSKGRFNTLVNGNDTYAYGYLANSSLIAQRTTTNSLKQFNAMTTFSYEPNRNQITSVNNTIGETSISKYDYVNDNLGFTCSS
jgi:hypothetical protein